MAKIRKCNPAVFVLGQLTTFLKALSETLFLNQHDTVIMPTRHGDHETDYNNITNHHYVDMWYRAITRQTCFQIC